MMRCDRRPEHMKRHTCRSLRIFQHRPAALDNFEMALVRIWSEQHRAYWRRAETGGGAGYVGGGRSAGVWPLKEAFLLAGHCGPEKQIWFEFVPAREARAMGLRSPARPQPTGRDMIRAERDLEIADFFDQYAAAVEQGLGHGPGPRRHPEEIRGPLVSALRGLASSIRAGLVDGPCDAGTKEAGNG
jgi:hypothetical protein